MLNLRNNRLLLFVVLGVEHNALVSLLEKGLEKIPKSAAQTSTSDNYVGGEV